MRDEVALSEARMTPPRPPIAFRVGVVGHRPDRLPRDEAGLEVLRARLAQVLEAVADAVHAFAAGPDAEFYASAATPILRANSPLAEGADRLFAEEALRLGYHLNCVMPFAQTEFEQDFQGPEAFEPQALEAFRALLARARALGALTRFELDGRRGRAREAYEAAGRVVLNQSDLLVVVWDGGGPNGAGGTVDTLRDAITYKVPALWIDARAPNGWRLLRDAAGLDCLAEETPCPPEVAPDAREEERQLREAIFSVVTGELALPPANAAAGAPSPETQRGLRAYLAERKPRANFAVLWKLFRDLMDGGRLRWPSFAVPDFVGAIRAGWPVDTDGESPHPGATASWINERLRAHYAWSDKLADHYADAHRSGFVWSSLLAAAAVFTALLPLAAHLRPRPAIAIGVIEALILTALVGLPILARRRRWHQRWMDYRVLAELIRELRIMIPLGGAQPPPRTSPHLASYGDPARSWMYWQVRAIGRATGLPDARVTAAYIADQVADLLDFIAGQSAFHHMNCERMERIHRRLHGLSLVLFAMTLVAVSINWIVRVVGRGADDAVGIWLILVCACFPALGAALASINNQGEFARLQRRSRAMAAGFGDMRARLVTLTEGGGAPTLAAVTAVCAEIAAMMVDENTEWRIVVLDLPHAAG